jgi:hypothetical protein
MLNNFSRQPKTENGPISAFSVSRWISANAIFTAPSILITLGIMQGLLYGFALWIATMIVFLVIKTVVKPVFPRMNGMEMRPETFEPIGGKRHYLIVVGYLQIYCAALGGGVVVSLLLSVPIVVGMFMFIVLGSIYSLGSFRSMFVHNMKLTILFIMTTGLLVYSYVTDSAVDIYRGIRLYHPYLLYINGSDIFLFFLASVIVFAGKLITDPVTRHHFLELENQKKMRVGIMFGFAWSTVPLAFSTIFLALIYKGGFRSFFSILQDLFHALDGMIFPIVAGLVFLFVFLDSFRMEKSILKYYAGKSEWHILSVLVMIILAAATAGENWLSFHYVFFMFGIWFAAFLPSLGRSLLHGGPGKKSQFASGLAASLIGYAAAYYYDFIIGVHAAFFTSLAFTLTLRLMSGKKQAAV